jgi:bile acid-coenzyme A ligase
MARGATAAHLQPALPRGGLTPFVEGLVSGNACHVASVLDGRRIHDLVDQHAIEWLQMTPFHMRALLAGSPGPASWRASPRLVHMADHCPARVKRAFHEALGPTRVYELYTASEGIGMTMARGDEWEERPGTVGRGFCTALRVADDDGRPLGAHQTGVVYMRSGARPAVTYLSAAGRLRITPDGFATLGDVGHLDEDGYLFLRPRQVETIAVAGVTVSPTEVEAELLEHPRIADVGVCAESSAEFGERVVAVVVPATDGLTEDAVRRWARARLSAAQVPARCLITSALPRTDSGKLDRAALFVVVNGTVAGVSEGG